ncbi:ABC transporter substrate-binding protein [Ornithinimicrobium sp. F0845]|uniref:siderophore ABC transporter substrate-binding protein n=1 Tax=Ornithinimicrobium sp. F0845 TaxID=2926412 RepID=UPI001FF66B3E|nr:ABC transporter substrate-binding protein [Ornithinimicrobium sp. F0845]MCK0111798.1 ABC transporter substrate-binding protein [Ornithinimicrobium sp. F0845]
MTRRHLTVPALGLIAALTLSACGGDSAADDGNGEAAGGETVSITDSQGRTVDVPVNPGTVVATDWSVIRTLSDLGIEVDAVPAANSALPDDIAQYAGGDVPTIGTLQEPDYEAINELEPDLIIIGSRSGTPEVLAEMEKISPNVIDMSVRFEESSQQIPATEERVVQLGSIFDKETEAQELMDDLTAQIEEVGTQAAATGETALFVQVSGGTASAYGPGSRFGIVYDAFGYTPTDAPIDEEGSHGQEISQEFFTEYNPGVLLVLDRAAAIGSDEAPALEVLNNDLVNTTDAATNDKIHVVDGFAWYLATAAPSSIQQMIDDVKATL